MREKSRPRWRRSGWWWALLGASRLMPPRRLASHYFARRSAPPSRRDGGLPRRNDSYLLCMLTAIKIPLRSTGGGKLFAQDHGRPHLHSSSALRRADMQGRTSHTPCSVLVLSVVAICGEPAALSGADCATRVVAPWGGRAECVQAADWVYRIRWVVEIIHAGAG